MIGFVLLALLLVACGAPTVTTRQAQTYVYYLPMVSTPKTGALKGVALISRTDAATLGAQWAYQYYPSVEDYGAADNVPMIRDANQWAKVKAGTIPVSANPRLLGFNEPDQCPNQACLSPEEAARLWVEIETLFPNRLLVSPAPSHLHLEWLTQFYDAFYVQYNRLPRVDIIAAHCYMWSAADCTAYLEQVKVMARTYGVNEVWVTEFGFSPCESRSLNETAREITTFVDWMKNDPMVTRYAWFTTRVPANCAWCGTKYWCQSPGLIDLNVLTFFGTLYKGF